MLPFRAIELPAFLVLRELIDAPSDELPHSWMLRSSKLYWLVRDPGSPGPHPDGLWIGISRVGKTPRNKKYDKISGESKWYGKIAASITIKAEQTHRCAFVLHEASYRIWTTTWMGVGRMGVGRNLSSGSGTILNQNGNHHTGDKKRSIKAHYQTITWKIFGAIKQRWINIYYLRQDQ